MTAPAELIARAREFSSVLAQELATALEQSEKARQDAEASTSQALRDLAEVRRELVIHKRDAQPVVDLVDRYQRAVDESKHDHRLLCQIIRIKLPKGTP